MLMIAFVYNNNLAYLLVFLLMSVFIVTILHTFKALDGLVIEKGQAQAVYAGEEAAFDLYINNPRTVERFGLQFKLSLAETPLKSLDDADLMSLKAAEKKLLRLYSPTHKRGWHPCEAIIISCGYPLGLFRAWSVLRFEFKALVYPKPALEDIPFPETAGSQAQQGTEKKGEGDFYGLREYQEGDAIRDIHWKAYAKGQGLFSKFYSGEALAELWLDYEQTRGADTEQRLSQLCRWLVDADQSGLQYGFVLAGLTIQPSSGTEHFKKCLKALALF
ncbi:MAG: DUF58 domain-containing protein [Methylococcaceae bacterium]|nr:DUF58 domain-containing protein [Methylococcaceae bacterium]